MKKFHFSLDTVLAYKQQILDSLKAEYAAAQGRVHAQEEVLAAVWRQYRAYNEEYRVRKAEGMTIADATFYQTGLRSLELEIQRETDTLEKLKAEAEEKREQMVEAKIDTSSLEKLRGKKLDLYQKAVQKDEELLIDEFVSAARVNSASA